MFLCRVVQGITLIIVVETAGSAIALPMFSHVTMAMPIAAQAATLTIALEQAAAGRILMSAIRLRHAGTRAGPSAETLTILTGTANLTANPYAASQDILIIVAGQVTAGRTATSATTPYGATDSGRRAPQAHTSPTVSTTTCTAAHQTSPITSMGNAQNALPTSP